MQFCPSCGTRLKIKLVKTDKESFMALACEKCGYFSRRIKAESVSLEEMEGSAPIKVVGDEASQIRTMPTTFVECPRCRNGEAEWWFVQTRSGDEPPTQFYRCTKCGYTWRQYS
jgi:DNA-directed RNA polymerase subunit M